MWTDAEFQRLMARERQQQFLAEAQNQQLLSKLPHTGLRTRVALILEAWAMHLHRLAERLEAGPIKFENPTHH